MKRYLVTQLVSMVIMQWPHLTLATRLLLKIDHPLIAEQKNGKKKALIYLTFRLICFFHGHVSFEHALSSKNFKNIPRYWDEIILLLRLNCNCSIDNPFVLRIILQRKWQYKQTLTEVVGDEKGIQQGFMRRCSYPRSNPLSFYIPYLTKLRVPLWYTFS